MIEFILGFLLGAISVIGYAIWRFTEIEVRIADGDKE